MKSSNAPDIIDVANAAGVSPATVSRTFNHPELVRADTRNRIAAAVDRLGYIRNRAASAMHGAKSGAVGLIVPTIDNAIFSNLIQAFSSRLQDAGQSLLIATHGYDAAAEHRLLRKFLEHRVDGVALIGLARQPRTYELIEARGTPTVLMWSYAADAPLPCVGSDNFRAGEMAAEHLLALGHRDIALMFPPLEGNDRALRRSAGALAALARADARPGAEWERTSTYHLGRARNAATALLSMHPRPTAILAGNDIIARGALAAAAALGLNAPRDLSVIGIGDFPGSAELHPALTTIRIDAQATGQSAADMLLARMSGETTEPERREAPLTLMKRETTAPPPGLAP